MPVVVILGAMLLIAFWAFLDHRKKMAGKGADPELKRQLEALRERLDQVEAERERLTRRVEHLEAIAAEEPLERPVLDASFDPEPLAEPDRQREEQRRRTR